MKTTLQNFSNMFRTAIIATTIFISGFYGSAQAAAVKTTTTQNTVSANLTLPGNTEVAGQAATTESTTTILKDANFWVNYLKTTVKPEDDSIQIQNNTLEEMQNDPTFWIHYLKETTLSE